MGVSQGDGTRDVCTYSTVPTYLTKNEKREGRASFRCPGAADHARRT